MLCFKGFVMLFTLICLIFLKIQFFFVIIWTLIWLLAKYCLYVILILNRGFSVKRICIKFIAHIQALFCYLLRYEIQIKCEKSLKLDCKMWMLKFILSEKYTFKNPWSCIIIDWNTNSMLKHKTLRTLLSEKNLITVLKVQCVKELILMFSVWHYQAHYLCSVSAWQTIVRKDFTFCDKFLGNHLVRKM